MTSPAPAAPAKKATATSSDRTAKSKACSVQADQKGLHGKARKKFRDECQKA
ncbi:PsiF family protein [Bosea sp. 2YAB26]